MDDFQENCLFSPVLQLEYKHQKEKKTSYGKKHRWQWMNLPNYAYLYEVWHKWHDINNEVCGFSCKFHWCSCSFIVSVTSFTSHPHCTAMCWVFRLFFLLFFFGMHILPCLLYRHCPWCFYSVEKLVTVNRNELFQNRIAIFVNFGVARVFTWNSNTEFQTSLMKIFSMVNYVAYQTFPGHLNIWNA